MGTDITLTFSDGTIAKFGDSMTDSDRAAIIRAVQKGLHKKPILGTVYGKIMEGPVMLTLDVNDQLTNATVQFVK